MWFEPMFAIHDLSLIHISGKPGDPGQLDMQVLMSYLAKVKQTVDLLGSYHIYTLLDMHQDPVSYTHLDVYKRQG